MLKKIKVDCAPFKGVEYTLDFTDCTVEDLIGVVASHIGTRYTQSQVRKAVEVAKENGVEPTLPDTLKSDAVLNVKAYATSYGATVSKEDAENRKLAKMLRAKGFDIPDALKHYLDEE